MKLIADHCDRAEIRPCEDILCPIDITEKGPKYRYIMDIES
jgi:hypothetical protein